SPNRQYWDEAQFQKLRAAPSRSLASQGQLPWRMLAYMLQLSPDVERVRHLVRKRLMEPKKIILAEKQLHQMLRTLHALGVVRLEPEPPVMDERETGKRGEAVSGAAEATEKAPAKQSEFARLMIAALKERHEATGEGPAPVDVAADEAESEYRPELAQPTA